MADGTFTVRIDPELRRLWRALGAGGPPETARAAAGGPTPAGEAPAAAPEPVADRPAATRPDERRRIALRRDGRRPLLIEGAPLLSTALDDDETGARVALALYLAADGSAAASLTLEPPPGAPARSVHLADRIDAPEELRRLLDRLDPADALPGVVGADPALAEAVRETGLRLAAAVARFRDGLRRSGTAAPSWRSTS